MQLAFGVAFAAPGTATSDTGAGGLAWESRVSFFQVPAPLNGRRLPSSATTPDLMHLLRGA